MTKAKRSIMEDDNMKGLCCYACSVYFDRAHGYPVLCKWCWNTFYPQIKKIKRLYKKNGRKYPLRKAKISEIDGIATMAREREQRRAQKTKIKKTQRVLSG
jgi:protein-arginine kinase activator protein McsA